MRPGQKLFQNKNWFVAQLMMLAAIPMVFGCGDGVASRNSVSGTVMVDGQPADGAVVILVPVGPIEGLESLRPTGVADGSGKFTLMTVEPGDGAPDGEYKALVEWPEAAKFNPTIGRDVPGPDRLKGKYSNPDTTTLTVTVDGATEIPPFELTAK